MSASLSRTVECTEGVTSPQGGISSATSSYLQRLNTLILIRHLALLMVELQKHRGASMAVLAGNKGFMEKVNRSQEVIRRHFEVIGYLNHQSGYMIAQDRCDAIINDWLALTANWRNDAVMTNFEFHNHHIDNIVKLIWSLAGSPCLAILVTPAPGVMPSVVLAITMKLMPELIENIARLRGLAAHVCSLGYCDEEYSSRFMVLLRALNMNKARLRTASRSLQHDTLKAIHSLLEILLHEHKLDQLEQIITTRVSSVEDIDIDSAELFEFASGVIDIYAQVVHDGISYFRRLVEGDLARV